MEREYEYEVTIGIPVYNIEKYVSRMMESVLVQTFQNIEILILDDCGTDSSIAIIQDYQQSHPRGKDVRIIRQPKNMGLGNGRNRIISEAKGKYLYFLDGDDSIMANTIELLYNAIQHYDAEIAYGSHYRIEEFDDDVKIIKMQYPAVHFLKEDEFANFAYQKYDRIFANTWNFLIDIEVYRKNDIKYKPINFWEDFTTTIDLPTYIKRAVLLPDFTYNYYCRYGSLSNFQIRSFISKKEIQQTISAMELVKANSDRIKTKPYFSGRMNKVMLTCFFMACSIIKKSDVIKPSFNKSEIVDLMKSPLTFWEICTISCKHFQNLVLCLISMFPTSISFLIIKKVGKIRGYI